MSRKKNYRGMYNQHEEKTSVVEETSAEMEEIPVVIGPVETVPLKMGTVKTRLNMRVSPNPISRVLCVLETSSKVQIAKECGEWYHVCNAAGQEGYCMKQYISVEE